MTDITLYSDDYATASKRFRNAAAALTWAVQSHAIEEYGPNGERLTVDVAMSPSNYSAPVIVISSGIHGVEGHFGSAVQLGLLRGLAARAENAASVRWVMLHALNPYGFAWRRRANEHNVDLNRNLLLPGQAFAGSPKGYAALDGLLNPTGKPPPWEPVGLKFMTVVARHGIRALKQAIAAGQYEYPRGLFYGGRRPSKMSELLERNFGRWLGDSKRVLHLDFHTGLGKWATYKLLVGQHLSEAQQQWLNRWLGAGSYETLDAKGVSYATRGDFGGWGHSRAAQRDYLYAAAEFGTYPERRVLAALRAENQCHHWAKPNDTATQQAKRRLVEAFFPRSKKWRAKALEEALRLVERATVGLISDDISHAA